MRLLRNCLALIAVFSFAAAAPAIADTAQFEIATPGRWLPLESGTAAFGPTDRYLWGEVPAWLTDGGYSFWQTMPGTGWPVVEYGKLSFSISESGPAYLAVSTRFGGGGNSSGNWLPEVSYLADLEADGWQSVSGGLTDIDRLTGNTDVEFLVMRRESIAGETFTYRTEKYIPPIPLAQAPPLPVITSFVIDPEQSVVSGTIIVGDIVATEQSPGSSVTSISGTLGVDLNTPGYLSFAKNGSFVLADQPGVFLPGDIPAQLAVLMADEFGDVFLTGLVQGFAGQLSSGGIALDDVGRFSPSEIVIHAIDGTMDYDVPVLNMTGSTPTTGAYPNDTLAEFGQLELEGGRQKLTVPFTIRFTGDVEGVEYQIIFDGNIVAYAVPEPTTWALAVGAAISGLFAIARRGSRRLR